MPGSGQIPYYVFMPKAQATGMTQTDFFAWARSKPGVQTARDSTMRAAWHNLSRGTGYIGAIESISENALVPKAYMVDPVYPGRQHRYTYTVGYEAKAEEAGSYLKQHVTVVSDTMLTKKEVLDTAESWATSEPSLYGIESQQHRIERIEQLIQ